MVTATTELEEGNARMSTPGTAPRPRGEYAKSAQRRKEIIAAAIDVFSESGFRDGSLRTVAERAGMTHAGMRHHFPTKAELLEAVLTWREEDSLARARRTHPVGIDVIRAWVASVEENTARPVLVELEVVLSAEALSADHPAHAYFDDLYRRAEELLTKALTTMAEEGQLQTGIEPALAGRLLLSATLGLQSLWLRNGSVDVANELRTFINVLLTSPL